MIWNLIKKNYKNFKIWEQPHTGKFYASHIKMPERTEHGDSYEEIINKINEFPEKYQKEISDWVKDTLALINKEN